MKQEEKKKLIDWAIAHKENIKIGEERYNTILTKDYVSLSDLLVYLNSA